MRWVTWFGQHEPGVFDGEEGRGQLHDHSNPNLILAFKIFQVVF